MNGATKAIDDLIAKTDISITRMSISVTNCLR